MAHRAQAITTHNFIRVHYRLEPMRDGEDGHIPSKRMPQSRLDDGIRLVVCVFPGEYAANVYAQTLPLYL